jgi:hypothetical protein
MKNKTLLIGLFLLTTVVVNAQQKILVKGYITSTEDYCNGARPTDEMLQDLAQEKPLANKIIFIKTIPKNPKTKPIFKKIKTDPNGRFEVLLLNGTQYHFLEEWKAKNFIAPKNTQDVTWDIDCLRARYNTPDLVLNVDKTHNRVFINYHKPCYFNPYCGQYSGPIAP